MSARFTPVAAPPSPRSLDLPTPIQIPPRVPYQLHPDTLDVTTWLGFGTSEGRAWAALMLRAAYLEDFDFSVSAANLKDGLVHVERIEGEPYGNWRLTLAEYPQSILCVLHGVRGSAGIQRAGLDYLTPRYSTEEAKFMLTGEEVGQPLLEVLNGGRYAAKPRAVVGHSYGGVIGAWLCAQGDDPQPFIGLQTFGTPKIGQQTGVDALTLPKFIYGAEDDPVIGFPPSYLRLNTAAELIAIWPLLSRAARATKAHLDAVWITLASIGQPMALDDDGNVGRMGGSVDDGRAWYARSGIGAGNLFNLQNFETTPGHLISRYYSRARRAFDTWQTLGQAAGPGGRNADVLALAITAAEVMEPGP